MVDPDSPNMFVQQEMTYVIINDPFNGAGDKAMLDVSMRMLIQVYRLPCIKWKRFPCNDWGRKKLVMFSMDIDNFRIFNNEFEDHAVGDKVLQIVGDVLARVARTFKVRAYRRSGDEFVVLGYFQNKEATVECGMELVYQANTDLEVTVERGSSENLVHHGSKTITISVGMAAYRLGQSKQEWEELAEQMMYIAKGSTMKIIETGEEISEDVIREIKANPKNRLVYWDWDNTTWFVKN